MELSITTPALLFPAISLLMLAYSTRFLGLANLIRTLHEKYLKDPSRKDIVTQIKSLRTRIRLIRTMQAMGVLSFIFCAICMYAIFRGWTHASFIIFAISILCFIISLFYSLLEITISMRALEVELKDIEDISSRNLFSEIIRKYDRD